MTNLQEEKPGSKKSKNSTSNITQSQPLDQVEADLNKNDSAATPASSKPGAKGGKSVGKEKNSNNKTIVS